MCKEVVPAVGKYFESTQNKTTSMELEMLN